MRNNISNKGNEIRKREYQTETPKGVSGSLGFLSSEG
jgi:hypothetical protein